VIQATLLWGAAEQLETEEDMTAYLEAALEDGDPTLILAALGDIARAKSCAIASSAGIIAISSPYCPLSTKPHRWTV
jgi:probable addiction module antidote protein